MDWNEAKQNLDALLGDAIERSPGLTSRERAALRRHLSNALDDAEPGELDRVRAERYELKCELDKARVEIKKLRNKAWWKTFRAVFAVRCTYSLPGKEAHDQAAFAADLAHGKLED